MGMSASEITELDGAILMAGAPTLRGMSAADRASPAYRNAPLKGIGVRTAEDAVAEHGRDVYRHRWTAPVSIADLDARPAEMAGPAIYGGVIGPQFGHVVSQSIGRLWVAEALPAGLPIVFANANPGLDRIPGYFSDLVQALGVANPLLLVTAPTRIGRLHLGPDLCNLEHRPTADPRFMDWLRRHRPAVDVDPALRVYVSRSRMGPRYGQYLQETLLEAALEGEGYRVIHPETLPILDQIDLYLRARQLLFADGSAIHLWSLVATEEQEAGIILRRPWQRNFKHWFRSFDRAKVRVFDRMIATFTGGGAAGRQPVALLDMDALWRDLAEEGFHPGTRGIGKAAGDVTGWLGQGAVAQFDWDAVSAALLATRPHVAPVGMAKGRA